MTVGLEVSVDFSVACNEIGSIPGYGGSDFVPSFAAAINGGVGGKLGVMYPGSTQTDTSVGAGACTDAETRHRRSGSSTQIYVVTAVLSYPSATLAAQDMSASRSTSGIAALQDALAMSVNDAIITTGLGGSAQPVTADAVIVTPATLSQEEADKSTDLTFLWIGLTFCVTLVVVVVTLYLKWRHRQRQMRMHDLSLQIENPQAWLKKRLQNDDPFRINKVKVAAVSGAPAFPTPSAAKKDVFAKATVREDPFDVLKKVRLDFLATASTPAKDMKNKRNKVGPATVSPKLNKTSEARAAFHKSNKEGARNKFSASGAVLQVKADDFDRATESSETFDRRDSNMWNRMSGGRHWRNSWAVRRAALEEMAGDSKGGIGRKKPAPFFPEKPSVGKRPIAIAPPPPSLLGSSGRSSTVRSSAGLPDKAVVDGDDLFSATLSVDEDNKDSQTHNERRREVEGHTSSPPARDRNQSNALRDASLAQLARERSAQAAVHPSSASDARRSVTLDSGRIPRGDDPNSPPRAPSGHPTPTAADHASDGDAQQQLTSPIPRPRLRRQSTILSDFSDVEV